MSCHVPSLTLFAMVTYKVPPQTIEPPSTSRHILSGIECPAALQNTHHGGMSDTAIKQKTN
jgi:hypothetical protein